MHVRMRKGASQRVHRSAIAETSQALCCGGAGIVAHITVLAPVQELNERLHRTRILQLGKRLGSDSPHILIWRGEGRDELWHRLAVVEPIQRERRLQADLALGIGEGCNELLDHLLPALIHGDASCLPSHAPGSPCPRRPMLCSLPGLVDRRGWSSAWRMGPIPCTLPWALLRPIAASDHGDDVGAVEQPIQEPLGQHRIGEEWIETLRLPVGRHHERSAAVPTATPTNTLRDWMRLRAKWS